MSSTGPVPSVPPGAVGESGPTRSVSLPAPAPRPKSRVGRWLSRQFPRAAEICDSVHDVPGRPGPDYAGWACVLLIGILAATVIEWSLMAYPIPAGSDEGQWIATARAFAGLAHPAAVVPFEYVPVSFMVLGALIRFAGDDVLLGARLYVGLVIVALGLASYYLAKSLVSNRAIAVFASALVVLQPAFLRLIYFGSYPFLLSCVFFALSVALAVRYLRSGRAWMLPVFWLCVTLTILTHSLSAAVMVGFLGLFGFFLLVLRRLPREFFVSAAGVGGFAIAAVGVGGYYLGTHLAKVPHPPYLATGSHLAPLSLSPLVSPFYIEPVLALLRHGVQIRNDPALANDVLLGLTVFILGVLFLFALGRPRWLSLSLLSVACWGLALAIEALAGVVLHIATDYSRFAFVLYLPLIMGVALALDAGYRVWTGELSTSPTAAPDVAPVGRRVAGSPRRRRRSTARPAAVVVALAVVAILFLASFETAPTIAAYEQKYSTIAHDAAFVRAIDLIQGSGLSGSVVTSNLQIQKWVQALTARDAYLSYYLQPYGFTQTRGYQEELTGISLASHYAVTNSLVYASVPAVTGPGFVNSTPTFGYYSLGLTHIVFRLDPRSVEVFGPSGVALPAYTPGVTNLSVAFPDPAVPDLSIRLSDPSFTVWANTSLAVGRPQAFFNVSVTSNSGLSLDGLQLNLSGRSAHPSPQNAYYHPGTAPQKAADWTPSGPFWAKSGGADHTNFTTQFLLGPSTLLVGAGTCGPSSFTPVAKRCHDTREVILRTAGSPAPRLGLSFSASVTPLPSLACNVAVLFSCFNPIADLPPTLSAPAIWSSFGARFIMIPLSPAPAGTSIALYLSAEYGFTNLMPAGSRYFLYEIPTSLG